MSMRSSIAACCRAACRRRALSTSPRRTASDKSRYILRKDDATFPQGFQAAACHSGIKKANGVLDLAIVTSTSSEPASAAACFTKNVFQAAPVQVSREILLRNKGKARSIVINSGCANAVTGKQDGSLVLSTGVIGQHVPIDKIETALPTIASKLGSGFGSWTDVSRAFMTTDTFPKLRTRRFKLGGKEVRLAGIDKGAGMIYPRMGPPSPPHATLLGLIATDASIAPEPLQRALTYAIDRSFNSISVDGDMSTNDSVIALANGASGSPEISSHQSADYEQFQDELTTFATELASLVVRDGEGATKFVSITVNGSPSYEDAHHIASVIARSPLVKTAIHGADANWGRILCAVGYSTPSTFTVDPSKVSVSFVPMYGGTPLRTLVNGEPEAVDEVLAKQILSQEDVSIVVDLQAGSESATYYTCDFSKEYVTINGDYRS